MTLLFSERPGAELLLTVAWPKVLFATPVTVFHRVSHVLLRLQRSAVKWSDTEPALDTPAELARGQTARLQCVSEAFRALGFSQELHSKLRGENVTSGQRECWVGVVFGVRKVETVTCFKTTDRRNITKWVIKHTATASESVVTGSCLQTKGTCPNSIFFYGSMRTIFCRVAALTDVACVTQHLMRQVHKRHV